MSALDLDSDWLLDVFEKERANDVRKVSDGKPSVAYEHQARPPLRRSVPRRKAAAASGRNSIPERQTVWFKEQPGFGLREYATGREMFIVQYPAITGNRTITIGNAKVIDVQTALDVARCCIYHSDPDRNLADERKRTRTLPMF